MPDTWWLYRTSNGGEPCEATPTAPGSIRTNTAWVKIVDTDRLVIARDRTNRTEQDLIFLWKVRS